MTSLYPIPQRTTRRKPKPKRPKGAPPRGQKNGQKNGAKALVANVSKLAAKCQCLSNVVDDDYDDAIEVHFLDSLLDSDMPLVPSICKSAPVKAKHDDGEGLNTSGFTDDTAVNTSNDDSVGGLSACMIGSGAMGVCDGKRRGPKAKDDGAPKGDGRDDEADDEGTVAASTAPGEMEGAGRWWIGSVWNSVVSSNMQCWHGTLADLSPERTHEKNFDARDDSDSTSAVEQRNRSGDNPNSASGPKSSRETKRDAGHLGNASFFTDEILGFNFNTLTALEPTERSDDSDEPLVGRQLFDTMGDDTRTSKKDSFGDDSESTAMTCNYSSGPSPFWGLPSSHNRDFHYLSEENERESATSTVMR